ncbi:penicillin-binding protein 2 [Brevundimonas naejangsanensis]|uniref:Penicillin-binding protein 2 n=1 Tax=Brevundimonas naejangsanensis TaxID=588932 RepID=A0A494RSC8_9CAUL|nr:penicillin-binding protein 2 [Brevundimonas naejangsanensis]AYG96404.1 penicillin-binding protein 2 [Brevundimonas naejangsanensis]
MSSEPSIFFSDVNERQGSFLRRTLLLGGGATLGIVALTGRLAQLQVVQAEEYATLATNNQFNFRLVPPPRGLIKDRNGVVIAGNRPSFRVLVVRDETKDLDQTLDLLGQLLPDTLERRRTIIREVNAAPRFSPVPVKSDLTWEEFSRVNLHAAELPGVMADMNEARYYPHGGAYAHVVGYVAKVSDRDVKAIRDKGEDPPSILFNPGFRIGRQGIEKSLDLDLRGVAGGNRVEVDARGRVVAEDIAGSRPAVQGAEVVLTLDNDVQQRALEVFGEESGGCVVMDVRNGDILAMVSSPSFDPNLFVSGVPSKVYRALADYERKPLLDKAIYGTFPPGSTFKMTTALAFLDAGIDPAERVVCTGGYRYGGRTFRCWKRGGHGAMDMHNAIKNSCDTYFYHLSNRAGVDRIARVAEDLGYHQTYDIGIAGQSKGLMPTTAWVKKARPRDPVWHPGETLSVAIGQGAVAATALQQAVMVSRLANGRKAIRPRLIKSIGGKEQPSGGDVPDLPFSDQHLDIVRAGMAAVANDVTGTAYRASQLGLGDIKMAGKTGTAQSRDYKAGESRGPRNAVWSRRDHALFVAFAPHDAPRYAIALIIQHAPSGGSADAAPRAREVMKVALLKDPEMRARIERPLPPEPTGPISEEEANFGAAPDAPVDEAAPSARPAPAASSGPRPYLSEEPR